MKLNLLPIVGKGSSHWDRAKSKLILSITASACQSKATVNLAKKVKIPLCAEEYFQDRSLLVLCMLLLQNTIPPLFVEVLHRDELFLHISQVASLSAEDAYSHCTATLQSLLPHLNIYQYCRSILMHSSSGVLLLKEYAT